MDRAQQLAAELMQARQELSQRQVELRRVTAERNALRTRLVREVARVRELESAFRGEAELRQQATELHTTTSASLRSRITELEQQLLERDQQLARGERAPARSGGGKSSSGLRGIRGIGPAYQRSLREHGIESIEQIAAWTDADVAEIADKLKLRVDRIKRENWVGQAQELVKARGGG